MYIFLQVYTADRTKLVWVCGLMVLQQCGSTWAQIMACCLRAQHYFLNQCWLIISEVWHNSPSVFQTTSAHQLLLMDAEAKFYVKKCAEHQPKCCNWPMLVNIVSQMLFTWGFFHKKLSLTSVWNSNYGCISSVSMSQTCIYVLYLYCKSYCVNSAIEVWVRIDNSNRTHNFSV